MENVNNAGSKGTDFQPLTQNPQDNAGSNLQTTGSNLQTTSGDVLGGNTSILVATPNGNVSVAPTQTSITAPIAVSTHSPWVARGGSLIILVITAVVVIAILRPPQKNPPPEEAPPEKPKSSPKKLKPKTPKKKKKSKKSKKR